MCRPKVARFREEAPTQTNQVTLPLQVAPQHDGTRRRPRTRAAARALLALPVADRTPAVWAKALRLFPPAAPGLASTASVEADFAADLAAAAEFDRRSALPSTLPREAVDEAVRRAPRGSAPGPSGLRMEHIRTLGGEGQADVATVVRLLAGEAAVRRVPPLAAHALSGANLLLLSKPGGVDADGLPRLRPIGMPEVLRKLAAVALAVAVRDDAAALLSPLQQGVGVGNACERVLHEVTAVLACRPTASLLQLDYRNAFNLVSLPAAVAKDGSTNGGAPPPGDVEAGPAGARRSRLRDSSPASDVTVEPRESTPL